MQFTLNYEVIEIQAFEISGLEIVLKDLQTLGFYVTEHIVTSLQRSPG